MINAKKISAGLIVGIALSGCASQEGVEGTHTPRGDGTDVIATGLDKGYQTSKLIHGQAAIVYDPDGCQNWIIDDGLEGYATPRYNPVTGLPVCDDKYPPGTVIGNYQTDDAGIPDRVTGPGRRTVVIRKRRP